MRRLTRRQAVTEGLLGLSALTLAGCGGSSPVNTGSTLRSTWRDPVGDGHLRVGPGERLTDRLELGGRSAAAGVLGTLAHVTDAHVLDAASPARVTFLDRLGPPLQSTFRPQETLTAQVLAGITAAIRMFGPQVVIQGGDLIDNDQSNELERALIALRGGLVRPGSGTDGYFGVQSAADPDPFYFRPDLDAPLYPGLLRQGSRQFVSRGIGASWYPVLGDHDVLVAGEIVPTALTRSLATGGRALWDLPSGLTLPRGLRAAAVSSPDGPPNPGLVDQFLRRALEGPTVSVPADPSRRQMLIDEVLARLCHAASPVALQSARLDYSVDLGPRLRLIVLDLVRREGGSGGFVSPEQPSWLARQLTDAAERWVIVVSHQPLASSVGGDTLLALLDSSPRVIAALSGHTHRNRIVPRRTGAGGYWLIATASLIDYPQQARALRIMSTAAGGVALQTWMLDHTLPGRLGHDRASALIHRRAGRTTERVRRRPAGSQCHAVPT